MKLSPIRSVPSMKLAGRVPGELHAELTAYATYYREVFGQSIALWSLVVEMLHTFVADDRAFRTWRRHHPDNAATRGDAMPNDGQRDGQRRGHGDHRARERN
jgi:hypothetical protein